MFKSRRSGLVRRLWRSRLVTDSDGRDGGRRGEERGGGGGGGGQRTRQHSGTGTGIKLHRRPLVVTHSEAAAEPPTEREEEEEEEQPDEDHRGIGSSMCVTDHRGSRQDPESDGRTVTCCLFGEWDVVRPRKDGRPEDELASTAHGFLKRLKETSLDALAKAVEARGAGGGGGGGLGLGSPCVMVPTGPSTELRLGAHRVSPPLLLCQLFRWSDLPPAARLKALSGCQSFGGAADGDQVCCNPYHYSRLCGPESPPPPYSLSRSDEPKPLDSTLSNTEAAPPHSSSPPHIMPRDYTDTGTSIGSSASGGGRRSRSHWCSVAYWEQRTRVGRLYPAYEPSLSIFYDLPQGTGLCLGQLHANAYSRYGRRCCNDDGGAQSHSQSHSHSHRGAGNKSSSSVQQTRSKIGFGIVLSREPDGVWVYNRSRHPVFVHSPTLDPPGSGRGGLSVKRVMPGFSLKVFDYERSSWMAERGVKPERSRDQEEEGPWDPHSVRISFAKGWGPCYSRQFITSCPCWLEVLLNNHR